MNFQLITIQTFNKMWFYRLDGETNQPNRKEKKVLAVFDNLADAEHFMNYEIDYNDDLQNARIELQETKEAENKPSLNTDISDRYGQEDVNEMTFHHHK